MSCVTANSLHYLQSLLFRVKQETIKWSDLLSCSAQGTLVLLKKSNCYDYLMIYTILLLAIYWYMNTWNLLLLVPVRTTHFSIKCNCQCWNMERSLILLIRFIGKHHSCHISYWCVIDINAKVYTYSCEIKPNL